MPALLPSAVARRIAVLAPVVLLLLLAPPADAADLVEPFGPGFSDLELFVSSGEGDAATESSGVVGFGLGDHLSLGLTLGAAEGDPAEAGFMLMYSRSLGRHGDLDLWAEYLPVGEEVELAGVNRALGVEWSGRSAGTVPYTRLSVVSEEGGDVGVHPLVGLRLPAWRGVELHLELSSEQPEDGSWPLHVAVGPNWQLAPGTELLPEISLIHQPDAGTTSVFFTLGVVIDPSVTGFGVGR